MNYKSTSQMFAISAIAAAIVVSAGSVAYAADQKVGAKGVTPTYPNCTALTGTAKSDCMTAKESTSNTAAQVAPGKKAAALGAAPKFPTQLKADGGATDPNTKKAVQGSAPQYPAKNDANGKPMESSAATMGTVTGSGPVGVKGTAPKYPGKPSTSEEASAVADKKTTGVRTVGAAPKYPAAKVPVAAGSDAGNQKVESGVSSSGVAPKFPKAK